MRNHFLSTLTVLIFCVTVFTSCTQSEKKAPEHVRSSLPEIKTAPTFVGINQQAQSFQSASLKGSVWLAYFFFTTCGGPCPAMNARAEALQKELSSPSFKFVGISVDPDTDTPATLHAYAARYHADSTRWTMLQMPWDSVKSVAVQGFLLAQGAENDPNLHSTRFVAVDKRGVIRGYFDGLDDNEIPKLRKAIQELLDEKP